MKWIKIWTILFNIKRWNELLSVGNSKKKKFTKNCPRLFLPEWKHCSTCFYICNFKKCNVIIFSLGCRLTSRQIPFIAFIHEEDASTARGFFRAPLENQKVILLISLIYSILVYVKFELTSWLYSFRPYRSIGLTSARINFAIHSSVHFYSLIF